LLVLSPALLQKHEGEPVHFIFQGVDPIDKNSLWWRVSTTGSLHFGGWNIRCLFVE